MVLFFMESYVLHYLSFEQNLFIVSFALCLAVIVVESGVHLEWLFLICVLLPHTMLC